MKEKKSLISWLLCLLFLASMTACNDDAEGTGEDLKGPDIQVSPVMIDFTDSQTATVSVSYPGPWKAELSEGCDWCSIDKENGEGDGVITVTLNDTYSSDMQSAKLIIRAVDSPILLKAVQLMRSGESFWVDPLVLDYGLGDDMTQTIKVSCKGAWTAKLSDDCTWCTIDKTSGNGEETLLLTSHMSLNPDNVKDATLTIASADHPDRTATIKVSYHDKYMHGSRITLQKATKGKGINFIITGDGFTEADMGKNGRWKQIMDRSLEAIFKYEPYTSFRDYFNVYAVTAVSPTNEFLNDTPSNTFYGIFYERGINPTGQMNHNMFMMEQANLGDVKPQDVTVLMILNHDKYGGIASFNASNYSIGMACVWDTSDNPINKPENMFPTLVAHEFLGHAFGHLADEYFSDGVRISEQDKAAIITNRDAYGWWQNIEFTDDRHQFHNPYWAQMLEMKYPGVDVIQGAAHYGLGVWRSSEDAMMRNQTSCPVFSPVEREIIYRRIHELAGLEYSFDAFIEWDKKNIE